MNKLTKDAFDYAVAQYPEFTKQPNETWGSATIAQDGYLHGYKSFDLTKFLFWLNDNFKYSTNGYYNDIRYYSPAEIHALYISIFLTPQSPQL